MVANREMPADGIPGSVGWARSPAAADDMAHWPRAPLPTRSNGEVGQRGQRRTTVRANATLCVMRLCPRNPPERALADGIPACRPWPRIGDFRRLAARARPRAANLKRTHNIVVAAQRCEEFALPSIDVVIEDRGKQHLVACTPLLDRHGQSL